MEHDPLENVNESSNLLVLRPKRSPLTDAVSFIKYDADDLVREAFRLEKLCEPEFVLLQEYLGVGDDNTVFASLNILQSEGYCLSYPRLQLIIYTHLEVLLRSIFASYCNCRDAGLF